MRTIPKTYSACFKLVIFFISVSIFCGKFLNRYRRKRPKVDASIFDSALSDTRRSDALEQRKENSVSTFGRLRLYRLMKTASNN